MYRHFVQGFINGTYIYPLSLSSLAMKSVPWMYSIYNMVLLLYVLVKCCPYNSMGHSIYRDLHLCGFTKSSSHITPALKANGFATNDIIRESMIQIRKTYSCREQNAVARPLWKKWFTPTTNPSTIQWPSHESRTQCFRHKNLQFGKITYTSGTSPQESWTMSHTRLQNQWQVVARHSTTNYSIILGQAMYMYHNMEARV